MLLMLLYQAPYNKCARILLDRAMRSRRSRPSIDGGNLGTGVTRRGDDCDMRSAGEQKSRFEILCVTRPILVALGQQGSRIFFFCVKNSPRDGIHHEPTLVGFCFPGISFRSGVPHPGIRGQRALPDIIAGGRRGDFIGHNLFFAFLVMEGFTSVLLNDHERLPSSGERPSLTIHTRVLKLPQVRTR